MIEIKRKEYRIKDLKDGSVEVIISNGLVEETVVLEMIEQDSSIHACLKCPNYLVGLQEPTCIACSDASRVLFDNSVMGSMGTICKSYKKTEVAFPDQEIKSFL